MTQIPLTQSFRGSLGGAVTRLTDAGVQAIIKAGNLKPVQGKLTAQDIGREALAGRIPCTVEIKYQ